MTSDVQLTTSVLTAIVEHSDDPVRELVRVLVVALDDGKPTEAAWIRRTLKRVADTYGVGEDFNDLAPGVLSALRREASRALNASEPDLERARQVVQAIRDAADVCRPWNEAADDIAGEIRDEERRRALQ